MTPKYIVLHVSQNWLYDGVAVSYFDKLKDAKALIREFIGNEHHKNDTFRIAKTLLQGKIYKIKDKYRFKV